MPTKICNVTLNREHEIILYACAEEKPSQRYFYPDDRIKAVIGRMLESQEPGSTHNEQWRNFWPVELIKDMRGRGDYAKSLKLEFDKNSYYYKQRCVELDHEDSDLKEEIRKDAERSKKNASVKDTTNLPRLAPRSLQPGAPRQVAHLPQIAYTQPIVASHQQRSHPGSSYQSRAGTYGDQQSGIGQITANMGAAQLTQTAEPSAMRAAYSAQRPSRQVPTLPPLSDFLHPSRFLSAADQINHEDEERAEAESRREWARRETARLDRLEQARLEQARLEQARLEQARLDQDRKRKAGGGNGQGAGDSRGPKAPRRKDGGSGRGGSHRSG